MVKQEWFNSISHLIAAVAALAALVWLVVLAARQGDPLKIVSVSIYGTTLLLLYTFSTLYHSLSGKAKKVFRKLDHASIYLLIAGTYTPFTLICLRGGWGWSLFGVVWGLAGVGMVADLLFKKRRPFLSISIYLSMGWLILIALKPLLRMLPPSGFTPLLLGGIIYTFGIIFYVFDKKVSYFHGIWHLFVIAGSIVHYFTVVLYLV